MDKLKSLMIFLRWSPTGHRPSAQLQSFSEAARQLSMSPSAVSRAVARLEDDLGIRLLQRTTRSLTLTEDGAKFYQRCQQILDELEAVELEVKQSQSKPKGTLRLSFSFTKCCLLANRSRQNVHCPPVGRIGAAISGFGV